MRFHFTTAVAALGLASSVLAAPAPVEKRSVVSELATTIEDVYSTVSGEATAITGILDSVLSIVGTVLNQLLSDLGITASALTSGATAVITETTGAVTALAEDEYEELINNLETVEDIITTLTSVLENVVDEEAENISNLVISEAKAVQNAVAPFVDPIIAFAKAVTCSDCTSDDLSALAAAISTVTSDLETLVGISL